MKQIKLKLAALGAAVVLASCGGGSDGVNFDSTVSFGDSLSDVGSYKVGTIAAVGGGKWTVNSSTAQNWTELVAASARTSAPCAAQTGLLPNIPGIVGAPVTNVPGCRNYAQGSARVSNPVGPNTAALQAAPFNQVTLGLMAIPLTTQMSTHLAAAGSYTGKELVTVMAGGNDLFMNFNGIAAAAGGGLTAVGAAAAAGWAADVQAAVAAGGAAATDAAVNAALTSMAQSGADLANLVKTQVLAKGARFVVVVNLPDASQSPSALLRDAPTRGLINTMVTTFNSQLQAGLSGASGVLYVDAYTQGRLQTASPAQFGLTNVTTPACSTTSPANPLAGSSITCTQASLIPGDTSGFLFADSSGHLTPLGYQLLANHVIAQMRTVGWL